MNSLISSEILLYEYEESFSYIKVVKVYGAYKREESGDSVFLLDLSSPIWVFRGGFVLDLSGVLLHGMYSVFLVMWGVVCVHWVVVKVV